MHIERRFQFVAWLERPEQLDLRQDRMTLAEGLLSGEVLANK